MVGSRDSSTVEWTPRAAGAQGGSWAEARPRPGKKPGSEEEDASELSCKWGLGILGMASNVAPEAFRSFTDFLVSGLNSFLSDPLRNPKRLPCPATCLPPCTPARESGLSPLPSPAAADQHMERQRVRVARRDFNSWSRIAYLQKQTKTQFDKTGSFSY